jgi:SagB-type dehydrogenase family enzyme
VTEAELTRSPFLVMTWDETGALVITDCNTLRRYEGSDLIVRILGLLSQPRTAAALVEALRSVPAVLVTRTLDFLRRSELVVEATASGPTLARWTLFELAMQRQLSLGGVRATPSGPRPPFAKEVPSEERIELPRAPAGEGPTLRSVLRTRRSRRRYNARSLSLRQLGEFLDVTASSSGHGDEEAESRPYPSGGACYPLELYLLTERVDELRRAVYHYDPLAHQLAPVREADVRYEELLEIVAGNAGGALNRPPCVVFLVTAVFARTMWRYAYLGLATIYRDVGCLFQTMYLVATEMGLAPCAIGGVQDVENARWLQHDALEEAQVGSFLLGMRE